MRTSFSTVIRRPVEEVYAFVTDPTNDLKWQPEISGVTVTSEGPLVAGSTFREVRKTFGRTFTWEMLITEMEPNRKICIKALKGTVPYEGCRTFETVQGGTRITETSEVRLGWPYKPFAPLLARVSTRPVRIAYAKLTRLLESRP